MTNLIKKSLILFLAISMTSCANYFQKAFVQDQALSDYKTDIIKKTENPQVYYIHNPELESIGIIENGYINLGYAYFERQEFNEEKQALDFAKEIGASLVLLQTKFERTKKTYENAANLYPISTIPVTTDSTTVYSSGYPLVNYSFSYDSKDKELKETVTTSAIPNIQYQAKYKNGKLVQEQINTNMATQVWNTPVEQRNYYAVPNGQGAVVIPIARQETEVEIHSYYASFWAKTNYPPALGVKVTTTDIETKNRLKLSNGVSVWAVDRNSPASKIPIYRGDILLSINDEPILNSLQMGELIRKNIGKNVKIEIFSNGSKHFKNVKLNNSSY